jgi:hypothetical protein
MDETLKYTLRELENCLAHVGITYETYGPITSMINELYYNHKRKQEEDSGKQPE